jgi:eukaryotic-like serine/threonine-protein kinase
MSDSTDRNLLYGVLAVQLDYIRPEQMLSAANYWMLNKKLSMGQILVELGSLTREDCDFLDVVVDRHVARTGSPSNSLSAIQESSLGVGKGDAVTELVSRLQSGKTDPSQQDRQETLHQGPLASSRLGPRFDLVRSLAKGGLGEVFVAHDQDLDREVALKKILDSSQVSVDVRQRFIAEAKITGGLEHPGVVPVHGLGTLPNGQPYYVMRLIRGRSLDETLHEYHKQREKGKLGSDGDRRFRALIRAIMDACYAIGYAHSRGVLHRDIKPQNIMLGKYGETLVVDWGLAKVLGSVPESVMLSELPMEEGRSGDSEPTAMGSVLGTPGYMSPEQAMGRIDELDRRSDVFSLGATLYAVLTGRAPYCAEKRFENLEAAKRGVFDKPRAINVDISRGLEAICLKAMAFRSADRYTTAIDLAEDLESWVAGDAVKALPETTLQRGLRWARRHQTAVASALVLLLVASSGLLLANWAISKQRDIARKERDIADQLRIVAEDKTEEANQSRLLAESNSHVSMEILDQFVVSLADDKWAQVPQLESERLRMVDLALGRFIELQKASPEDEQLKARVVELLMRSANLYRISGRDEEAFRNIDQAFQLARERLSLYPDDTAKLAQLGDTMVYYNEAVLNRSGPKVAMPGAVQGVAIARRRIELSRSPIAKLALSMALAQQADLYQRLGEFQQAIDLATEGEELLRQTKLSAARAVYAPLIRSEHMMLIAGSHLALKRFDEATLAASQAIELAEEAIELAPGMVDVENYQQLALLMQARVNLARGDDAAAQEQLEACLEYFQQRAKDFTEVTLYREQSAEILRLLSGLAMHRDDRPLARQQATQSLETYRQLAGDTPINSKLLPLQVLSQFALLQTLDPNQEQDAAYREELSQELARDRERLRRESPNAPEWNQSQ